MDANDRAIIATLEFYGAQNRSLTMAEVVDRSIARTRSPGADGVLTLTEAALRLEALVQQGTLRSAYGLYALKHSTADIFLLRVQQEKDTVQKWRNMRRWAWLLQVVPYIRGLYASGSLASGAVRPESDWDVLVLAQTGHLYTARIFLLGIAKLMGRLRTKHDAIAPDRFCFNRYLTTTHLSIEHRSLYVAHMLYELTPIFEEEEYLKKIQAGNAWVREWIAGPWNATVVRRKLRPSKALHGIKNVIEVILDHSFGNWLEQRLRQWQQQRINRDPRTNTPGGRIIANDHELEFHPHSAEVSILAAYNRALERHGWGEYTEKDSGLTK